jgi:cell division protein ZapA
VSITRVEIFGQSYQIRGELDEAYVAELARQVDAKMRAVAEATGLVDTQRIAVLAALAFADELLTLRQRQQQLEGELRDRAERCINLVDRALEKSA